MPNVVHTTTLSTGIWNPQKAQTCGGRIVGAFPAAAVANLIVLFFEVDRDQYNSMVNPNRNFLVASTGQVVPEGYEHVLVIEMDPGIYYHIYEEKVDG